MNSPPPPAPLFSGEARQAAYAARRALQRLAAIGHLGEHTRALMTLDSALWAIQDQADFEEVLPPEPRYKREFPRGTSVGHRPTPTPCYEELVEMGGVEAARTILEF